MSKITAAAARTAAAATAVRLREVGTCENLVRDAIGDLRTATLVAYVDTFRDVKVTKITTATAVVALVKGDVKIPQHLRWQSSTAMTYAMLTAQVIMADGENPDAWTYLAGLDSTEKIVKALKALERNLKIISDVKLVERLIRSSANTAAALEIIATHADKITEEKANSDKSDESDAEGESDDASETDVVKLLTAALSTYRAALEIVHRAPETVTTDAENLIKAFGALSLRSLDEIEAAQVAALKAEQSA